MAEETINIGTTANDHTGEGLRDAFAKVKRMFTELYAKFVTTEALTATHTGQIAALQGGQTSLAGQISAIQGQLTDGATFFRFRTVDGVLYIEQTLTATGFAGVEDTDYTVITSFQNQ